MLDVRSIHCPNKMNVEHPTSNIQHRMEKQTEGAKDGKEI
jgi:hypothetical protein